MLPAPGLWTFACSCRAPGRRMRSSNDWLLNSSRPEHGRRRLHDALLGLRRREKARKQQAGSRPVISCLANGGSSRPKSTVLSQRRSESIDYCGLRLRRRAVFAILAIHPFSAGLLGAEFRLRSPHFGNVAQIRVHVLYRRPEIPANKVVPAIAGSVTYRNHEKVENTGSIPVSATIFSYTYWRSAHTCSHNFRFLEVCC